MRSSNKRSRTKSNRNRPSGGNVVNRVFDSSGPEGKVRGTPQQIIDKYNQLTRDAQLSGDRVAAENFAQHAEHYTRMLAEAQREMNERQSQQDQNQNRQQNNNQQGGNQQNDHQQGRDSDHQQGRGSSQDGDRQQGRPQDGDHQQGRSGSRGVDQPQGSNDQPEVKQPDAQPEQAATEGEAPKPAPKRRRSRRKDDDVIDTPQGDESSLVETPESKSETPEAKPRRTRARKPKVSESDSGSDESGSGDADGKDKTQAAE